MQKYLCCSSGWIFRLLHILVGGGLLSIVGMVVGLSEPELVRFIIERLPKDRLTQKILDAVQINSRTRTTNRKQDRKKRM